MGERDIHKKILEIPIPQFDKSDTTHMRLAEIGKFSSEKVEDFAKSGALVGTLAKRRGTVRELLAAQLGEIDGLVEKMLG